MSSSSQESTVLSVLVSTIREFATAKTTQCGLNQGYVLDVTPLYQNGEFVNEVQGVVGLAEVERESR